MPAGDIAENPYWKRDVRRSYPKLSVVRQPDVVALLSVGSAAQPKEDKLQIGEAGKKQLVALKEEGEKGLSAFFEKEKSMAAGVLGPNGMPPLPARYGVTPTAPKYVLDSDEGQAYGPKYVELCVISYRTISRVLTFLQLPLQDLCVDGRSSIGVFWGVHRLSPELMSNMFFCINDYLTDKVLCAVRLSPQSNRILGWSRQGRSDFHLRRLPETRASHRHLSEL